MGLGAAAGGVAAASLWAVVAMPPWGRARAGRGAGSRQPDHGLRRKLAVHRTGPPWLGRSGPALGMSSPQNALRPREEPLKKPLLLLAKMAWRPWNARYPHP